MSGCSWTVLSAEGFCLWPSGPRGHPDTAEAPSQVNTFELGITLCQPPILSLERDELCVQGLCLLCVGGGKLKTEFDIHALKGHLAQGDDLVGKVVAVPTLPSLVQSPEPM